MVRFNSRAHGGRDDVGGKAVFAFPVSIHAPTGGATHGRATDTAQARRFNSRAHGGRDSSHGL